MVDKISKFSILDVSSKFAICGMPIRADTYKTCSFGCKYCFSENKVIMGHDRQIGIGNIPALERKLNKVLNKKEFNEANFLDMLISKGYTWHCGGMSDPFQPCEQKYKITEQMVDLANEYGIHILFSTKSDTTYGAKLNPDLHAFQLSVTNVDNMRNIEPNVPDIEKRVAFFKDLKDRGFKVGIRIQPFIPNVATLKIVEKFSDADHFTLEGVKIVPQNKESKEFILNELNMNREDFFQMGLLNLKPEIRENMYKEFIDYFESHGISYSISDNDMRYLTNNKCCCGDCLVHKSTDFNTTAMLYEYGMGYSKVQLDKEIDTSGLGECKANQLFTSNRQEGCVTVQDFFDKRFDRKSSPFSPKFQYVPKTTLDNWK